MFVVPMSRRSSPFPQAINRLLEDRLERAFTTGAECAAGTTRRPALDVTDNDAEFVAVLDMPGVAKEDVKITVEGRRITVQAEPAKAAATANDGARLIHRERTAPAYARSFTLPADVEQTASQARLEHGVLTLKLPKVRARSAANITVN
jgi:HSP20 family protein